MPELQRLTRVTAQELVGVRVGGPVDLGDSLDVHLRDERACSRRASGYGGTFDSQPCVLWVARRGDGGWARQMYAGALRVGGTADDDRATQIRIAIAGHREARDSDQPVVQSARRIGRGSHHHL